MKRLGFVLVLFFIQSFSCVFASVSISVIPYDGGSTLRFGHLDGTGQINKQVKLRISSDSGQYQVFQRVLEPIVNERGQSLPLETITSYAIRGSNSSGSLYQEDAVGLSYSDQLLYSSDAPGSSDSFKMIYSVIPGEINYDGNFFGKIIYTVQPLGGGVQRTYIMDVLLNKSGQLSFEISGSSGLNLVKLSTQSERLKSGYVSFSFSGNSGQKVSFYQQEVQGLFNEMNEELPPEAVQFSVISEGGESYYPEFAPMGRKSSLLCRTEQSQGKVIINLRLTPELIEQQGAGIYQGKIYYSVESDQGQSQFSLDLIVEITPVFKLEAEYPPGGIRFNVVPDSPPVKKEVIITVRSNLKKPYLVTQRMRGPLAALENQKIPGGAFTLRQEILDQSEGEVGFPEQVSVSFDETTIFFSDSKGSPARFKLIYMIKPSLSIVPGDYSTIMSYSLQER